MKLTPTEMIYAAIAGAIIGLVYRGYSASGEPGGIESIAPAAWAVAALIGAAAALLAFAVRRWVDSAQD